MKGCVLLLLTIFCLLVSGRQGYACGSKHAFVKKETRHVQPLRNSCHTHHASGQCQQCMHHCGESGCDCAHPATAFAVKTQPVDLSEKPFHGVGNHISWFFRQAIPKPVYLALWMPPNISC
ncbi:hypothetical protein J2Y45_003767 [Dyadobacter sp. BE34]|uniref:Uncharacterized protein n=1 Tax=Dyadobacter fermentans TaxID=94254 RepID=A0ABU1R216_9BACT|nr:MULTISPECIES: hypothetical protein [Dyadobacter]MDR6806575.1 hypothetical protein [Dyadobacter fermentans]MDR7044316.1 hypothetical protein [Dyadobacter sp. BE242]MDR7198627.1 hypothetical protein [Dyadobacter sp. BE34]MDR7216589.1 hypothetical protein [Dyadobacter sp. BE31]MDR7263885.1 hypothetical protein [Dyadobacter sp. BE32]